LITAIGPDVLVKGGDWKAEDMIGSDIVIGRGGEVHSLKLVGGFSTTALVRKIRQ